VQEEKNIGPADAKPSDPDTTTDTRGGEEVIQQEGSESGRTPGAGTKGESQRPYGTAEGESATGVAQDRSEPKESGMPDVPPGDQAG
jgi:hypothetical protein